MDSTPSANTNTLSTRFTAQDYARYLSAMNLADWDEGGELSHFAYLRTSMAFPVATIPRAGEVSPLEEAPDSAIADYEVELADGRTLRFDDFVSNEAYVDGIVFVHRGRIAYESYPHMQADDRHLLFSVTKAFVGTLVGILEEEGRLSISEPIERYIPELEGTAWASTPVRDILDMTSGIAAPDGDLLNPKSEHYRLESSLGIMPIVDELPDVCKQARTYDYLKTQGRATEPGVNRVYSSANTLVLSWLVEKVTGMSFSDALYAYFWSKIGAEEDAQMVCNRLGIAVSHAGLCATLRDVARWGLLFTASWNKVAEQPVVPERLIERIQQGRQGLTEPSRTFPKEDRNGLPGVYQWDRARQSGAFHKSGYAGQWLYVSPAANLVVAYAGTEEFRDNNPPFAAIVRKLISDLFE